MGFSAVCPPIPHVVSFDERTVGELQDLFGRDVDLVEARTIRNPYFQQAVDRERVELYAA